jgi:hypothetical protein
MRQSARAGGLEICLAVGDLRNARCALQPCEGQPAQARASQGWTHLAMTTMPPSGPDAPGARPAKQLLHLVFGGELKSLEGIEFTNLAELDIVGIYPNYAEAYKAWKAAAQRTVDNAQVRYFIVHMHRLLDPAATGASTGPQSMQ